MIAHVFRFGLCTGALILGAACKPKSSRDFVRTPSSALQPSVADGELLLVTVEDRSPTLHHIPQEPFDLAFRLNPSAQLEIPEPSLEDMQHWVDLDLVPTVPTNTGTLVEYLTGEAVPPSCYDFLFESTTKLLWLGEDVDTALWTSSKAITVHSAGQLCNEGPGDTLDSMRLSSRFTEPEVGLTNIASLLALAGVEVLDDDGLELAAPLAIPRLGVPNRAPVTTSKGPEVPALNVPKVPSLKTTPPKPNGGFTLPSLKNLPTKGGEVPNSSKLAKEGKGKKNSRHGRRHRPRPQKSKSGPANLQSSKKRSSIHKNARKSSVTQVQSGPRVNVPRINAPLTRELKDVPAAEPKYLDVYRAEFVSSSNNPTGVIRAGEADISFHRTPDGEEFVAKTFHSGKEASFVEESLTYYRHLSGMKGLVRTLGGDLRNNALLMERMDGDLISQSKTLDWSHKMQLAKEITDFAKGVESKGWQLTDLKGQNVLVKAENGKVRLGMADPSIRKIGESDASGRTPYTEGYKDPYNTSADFKNGQQNYSVAMTQLEMFLDAKFEDIYLGLKLLKFGDAYPHINAGAFHKMLVGIVDGKKIDDIEGLPDSVPRKNSEQVEYYTKLQSDLQAAPSQVQDYLKQAIIPQLKVEQSKLLSGQRLKQDGTPLTLDDMSALATRLLDGSSQ